jgi:hypothetical protein
MNHKYVYKEDLKMAKDNNTTTNNKPKENSVLNANFSLPNGKEVHAFIGEGGSGSFSIGETKVNTNSNYVGVKTDKFSISADFEKRIIRVFVDGELVTQTKF